MRPSLSSGRAPSRLLFVHAHPDDETLATGVAMAHHVAAGDEVYLLTCTLGEEGEVIPPELRHLAADRDDALGPYRREELRQAMAVLGVQHTVLGEDPVRGGSRYRDSGMAGTPSADRPGAFVRADLAEAAALVAALIQRVRPSVVVTYDPAGGYAHPDHIQTHRVTMAALRSLPPAERPGRVFCSLTPAAWMGQDRRWLGAHVDRSRHPRVRIPAAGDPYPPSVVDDARVTHAIRDRHAARTQVRALREHRTQVTVLDADGTYYALSNNIAARLAGREGYALLDLQTGEPVRDTLPGAARHTSLLPQSGEAT